MTLTPEDNTLAQAVFQRHSVRSFRLRQPGERTVSALRSEVQYAVSRDAAIHFQLKLDDNAPFEGFRASYGMFRNVRNYVACVVDTSYDNCLQRAGFWAEMIALKAVSLSLGTCFVSGTYRPERVAALLRVTWRLPFILTFGLPEEEDTTFMARMMRRLAKSDRRPSAADVLSQDSLSYDVVMRRWPELKMPLASVAAAPSSMNRRPVRIRVSESEEGMPHVAACMAREYAQSEIDMGIALANWQAVARGEWDFGPEPVWSP